MSASLPDQSEVLDAIREAAKALGRPPSLSEFKSSSGMTEYQVLRFFPSWREAVRAAGLEPYSANTPVAFEVLLEDWGEVVRRLRRIPTREAYRREGAYSPSVFGNKIGPWSNMTSKFREFADGKPEWSDVLALLPPSVADHTFPTRAGSLEPALTARRSVKLSDRPTYGNPIDFRGLRHEPVNGDGSFSCSEWWRGNLVTWLRPSKLAIPIAKPNGKLMRGSGSEYELNLSLKVGTSASMAILQMAATPSSAGVIIGQIAHRILKSWNYAQ
jgi:Homing endonuclease associated repeat